MTDAGKLWIVATPIGNLQDITPRAIDVLSSADIILAEDTRKSGHLLAALHISGPKLVSFYDHNEEEKIPWVLEQLAAGFKIALISDAGTPLISDPGYRLVAKCRKEGVAIVPIPGPSAPVVALQAAGLHPLPYTFLGFLPRGEGDKRELFKSFSQVTTTLIFFERADRLKGSLALALKVLGPREVAICRELTKVYEEFIALNLRDYQNLPELLGEITVVLGPTQELTKTNEAIVASLVESYSAVTPKTKEIIALLQDSVTGWTNKELYAFIEKIKAHSATI